MITVFTLVNPEFCAMVILGYLGGNLGFFLGGVDNFFGLAHPAFLQRFFSEFFHVYYYIIDL